MLFLDARATTAADFPPVADCAESPISIPAPIIDPVTFSLGVSCAVSTIVGRRCFGFGGKSKVAVKDQVRSLIQRLFEN